MNEKIKTPYFLIKKEEIDNNIKVFQDALKKYWPNSCLGYSVKTNSLPWILEYLKTQNVYAEVVSDEEYELSKLCGFGINKIISNGPIKGENAFKESIHSGAFVNIDSKNDIKYVISNNLQNFNNLGIRINVNSDRFSKEDIGYEEDGFRFGFSDETGELQEAINALSKDKGTCKLGMHLHVNSVTRSVNVYKEIAKYAIELMKKYRWNPPYIDIGGGFFGGVPGRANADDYICAVSEILKKYVDISNVKLIVEPGSAIIGSAVDYVTSVIDIKDTVHSRIVTTDGSRVNVDPLWIKKNYLYSINNIDGRDLHPYQVICGYTCMDHDRIMTIKEQPELKTGDIITYQKVGNYTITFGGPFIRYFPEVYVNNGKEIVKVRKRMSVDDYYRIESM